MAWLVAPLVISEPWLVSVFPARAEIVEALDAAVEIVPWFSTVLASCTPMARKPAATVAPGCTVTLTLVLPAAAVMTNAGGVGLGAVVSQTTLCPVAGWPVPPEIVVPVV